MLAHMCSGDIPCGSRSEALQALSPGKQNISSPAYAKINLSLDITGKMGDGYHALETVMQTVSLADTVTIVSASHSSTERVMDTETPDIAVNSGAPYIPGGMRNIAAKAAAAFFRHANISEYQIEISIDKKIPVCAGLGGGSADAACVLRMLDEMHKTGMSRTELEMLGYTVGADVPFCVTGGTKLAKGRGEILTDLQGMPECFIVICKPQFSCPTPELFARIDCRQIKERPDTKGLLEAINAADTAGIARRVYNVFENFLPRGKDEIDGIKDTLIEHGALGASMTGSGSAVFGIFGNAQNAKNAQSFLLNKSYSDCYIATPIRQLIMNNE